MARPGKEQIFFLGSVAICGLLGVFLFTGESRRLSAPRGKQPDPASLVARDVPRAPRGALSESGWVREGRDAFLEPRDWLPLPPADLERPPLREPSYVPPPPRPSAALDELGIYRQPARVEPHAFPEERASGEEAPAEDGPINAAAAARAAAGDDAATGRAPAGGAAGTSTLPPPDDSEFKRLFDWLEVVADTKPWYGVIENKDKFTLDRRPEEPVQFRRIDPVKRTLLGAGSIERARIKEGGIHFAETAANRTELLLLAHPESGWSASSLPRLLDTAEQVMALGAEDPVAWRRAAEHLVRFIDLDPSHARTYVLLADAHASLLDYESELKALLRARENGVESPALIVRHARWLARAGAKAGARARLQAGVARFPADRELRLACGRALLEEGSPESIEAALQHFAGAEQASGSTGERIEVIAETGAALLEQGDAARALAEAQRILKIDRASPLGLRLAGAADLALRDFVSASEQFGALLQAAPDDAARAEAALSLGIVRTRLSEFDDARADLARVGTIDPRLGPAAALAEADLLAVTDHAADAIARCRAAAEGAPRDPFTRYYLGRLLRQSGDLEGARTELRAALDLGAAFPDLFTELGYVALLSGRALDARRYFEESLAREERDEAKLMLAHVHLLAGDLPAARALFEALQAARPTGEALLGLAYCAYERGESPLAQQLWVQVAEELPSAHQDDKAYAKRWLERVLDLESKQVWEDTIAWQEVGNGWRLEQRYDVEERVEPGVFTLRGTQRPGTTIDQWTWIERDVDLASFYEYEVDVSFGADHQGRVGLGLAHFSGGGASAQAPQVRASLMLALEPGGKLFLQQRQHIDDAEWTAVGEVEVAAGEPVTLTLRRKERSSAHFMVLVNGAPLGDWLEMGAWRGKQRQQLAALFFAAAPGGKKCNAELRRARLIQFLASP